MQIFDEYSRNYVLYFANVVMIEGATIWKIHRKYILLYVHQESPLRAANRAEPDATVAKR